MIRFLTAGESHGRCLVGILEGIPAGLAISEDEIAADLRRRQLGYGRGERMKIESDRAQILSGVRYGETLGSPIALLIENKDWPNWEDRMRVEAIPDAEKTEPLTTPRPGHADYAGAVKYQHRDIRNVIERSSARETAMRVGLAAICRKFLQEFGITVSSHVVRIGSVRSEQSGGASADNMNERADQSPVRCLDAEAGHAMMSAIDEAKAHGDSLGGVFEVVATGIPVGLGSYVQYDRRLDAILAEAVMSIPAIKSVEVGLGAESAERLGSEVHDELFAGEGGDIVRKTNNVGGIEGGISTGEPIVIRAAMKPLSTLARPLNTVDMKTGEATVALRERSDVCAVPAASIVSEAVIMLALMNPFFEKFGGDSMQEIRSHFKLPKSPWA